jgi:hypothetical protein
MAPPANRAEMLALAAARGIALCPLALEDYDELFVTLTGDNGSGVVKAFANDELAAFSTSDLAGVRTPTVTPHHTRTMSCAFPPHFSCGFETPALCRRRVVTHDLPPFFESVGFQARRRHAEAIYTHVLHTGYAVQRCTAAAEPRHCGELLSSSYTRQPPLKTFLSSKPRHGCLHSIPHPSPNGCTTYIPRTTYAAVCLTF